MNLDEALGQFDATETTLRRLEAVSERMLALTPSDIAFMGGSPEGAEYENLRRAFKELARGLPAIEGWVIDDFPSALDEIAQNRFDAQDIGEIEAIVAAEQAVTAPGEAIAEYRFRFNRARRDLVRRRGEELVREIDTLLPELVARVESNNEPIEDPRWVALADSIRELERLLGSSMTTMGRWPTLRRHLAFAQGCDLHDIARLDWPSVREDVQAALYGEFDPMPVQVADLADLAASSPPGPVSTELAWDTLVDEQFERLVFSLMSEAPGYENPQWLMRTYAPDRGRDLSVNRTTTDALSGVRHERVIVQCRHWLMRSLSVRDVAAAAAAVKLWEPPPVDGLIIATSGRFTGDAVAWIEKSNHDRVRPAIEMWPESHIESLLASRPHLIAAFKLRGGNI